MTAIQSTDAQREFPYSRRDLDRPTQRKILARMVKLMCSDGMYVAGHSENFTMYPELVAPMGKTIYRPVV